MWMNCWDLKHSFRSPKIHMLLLQCYLQYVCDFDLTHAGLFVLYNPMNVELSIFRSPRPPVSLSPSDLPWFSQPPPPPMPSPPSPTNSALPWLCFILHLPSGSMCSSLTHFISWVSCSPISSISHLPPSSGSIYHLSYLTDSCVCSLMCLHLLPSSFSLCLNLHLLSYRTQSAPFSSQLFLPTIIHLSPSAYLPLFTVAASPGLVLPSRLLILFTRSILMHCLALKYRPSISLHICCLIRRVRSAVCFLF